MLAFAAPCALAQGYQWTNFVGLAGNVGTTDGTGSAARLNHPLGVAIDGSGNVYVADSNNHTIRMITSGGVVSTLAGLAGSPGSSDGTGSSARFNSPHGLAVDGSGNVYVADTNNNTIRMVTSGGVVSTLAGLAGSSGSSGGTGSAARFNAPTGVAVDGNGIVYVADLNNYTIRKVTSGGVVSTLAGLANGSGSIDGTGSGARFYLPYGVSVDSGGNVYVADEGNNTIRKVTSGGVVSTLAGLAGISGSSNGTGNNARFYNPTGVAVDGSGNAYVADSSNNTIRMVMPGGVVSTIGGTAGASGSTDGLGTAARFSGPYGVAVSSTGAVFVVDTNNSRISMGVVVTTPVPLTSPAGSITGTGATLNGTMNANGFSTAVSFDYGLTTAYGSNVAGTPTPVTGSSATSVSAAITGLSPGTTYHFRVNGTSSQGTAYGSDQTFTTSGAAPTTTTLAAASISGTGASLNGTVNANGLSTAVSFDYGLTTAYGTNIAGTPTPVTGSSATSVSATISGLSPGTTYHFRVNGSNSGGTTYGSDQTFTTSAVPPTVTSLAAASVSSTGATLNGTVNANGFSTAVSFDYGLTTAYGTNIAGTPTPVTGSSATSVSAVISGLSPGTTYHYRVNGTSSGGTSNGSDQTFTTSAAPPTVTSLAAASITSTGATLNGTINANGFSTAVSFDYGLTTAYGTNVAGTPTPVTGSSATAVSAVISGLSPGTTYHFRVNGTNSAGTTNGSDQTFTTSGAAPTTTTLAAASITGAGATLNGTVNANGFSTAVSFDYGLTTAYGTNVAGTPTPVTGSSTTSVSTVITGLSPGTTYHFRVNGANSAGTTNGGDLTFTTNGPTGQYAWTNFVGMPGNIGSTDGTGSGAWFNQPSGVAVDGSGNLYVADQLNHTIRKVTSGGVVSTLAGLAGSTGSSDGTGSAARFNGPLGVAVDSGGNVYVADSKNHTVRKVTSGGVVSTLAGVAGSPGSSDGTGSAARFNGPAGVAVDGSGNVYVADNGNSTIRKVAPGGVVSTFAGLAGSFGSTDGTVSVALLNAPTGVAVDGSGNVYVADNGNSTVRKVTSGGVVSTLAGHAGSYGSSNGTGSAARFNGATGVAVDSGGNVYVADNGNWTIRKVTSDGVVSTLAGLALNNGSSDGNGSAARFYYPYGVAVDGSGNVYVADTSNNTIRKVTSGGVVSTLAGLAGSSGSTDGTGRAALFDGPAGVAVDGSGNVYVADSYNDTIRMVTSGGVVTTLAGLTGGWGSSDGTGSAARFGQTAGLAVDSSGNVYVADRDNHTIRKVTSGGVVTTLAGLAGSSGSSNGTGSAARFKNPSSVAVDGSGNVYVADSGNYTIRKITSGGVVSTLAGVAGVGGSSDGTGSSAFFGYVYGLAVDGSGNVYVADSSNNCVRKVTPGGVVSTLAGLATALTGSSDGTGSAARFYYPEGVGVDGSGNVYVTDSLNNTIRKVTPAGVVSTIGGTAGVFGGADGLGASASFSFPRGIAVSNSGTVIVADTNNNRISMGVVVPTPIPVTAPATSITSAGATLNGTVNANGYSTTVSFDYGLTTAYGTNVAGTPTPVTGSSATAVSAVITGLSPGTTYHFRVNGTSSQGATNGNDQTFSTSGTPPAATTLAATSTTMNGATLNGTVNANGFSTAVSFDYGLTTAYGTNVAGTPTPVTGSSATAVSAVITGLSPGTTYHFRVNGTSSQGTANGGDLTFTTAFTPVSWRQQWFSTTSNTGSAADAADPFQTGVPNLVVFALLGQTQNPARVTASMLPQPQKSGGNFVYTFTQPAGVSNITYGAQYSPSLTPANWQPVTDTGSGTQHIFSVPVGSNTRIFMRLTLTNLGP